MPAFHHALALLAPANRCRLDVIHVAQGGGHRLAGLSGGPRHAGAPGRIAPGTASAVLEQTGVAVRKVGIHESNAAAGLAEFLKGHRPSLVVMASHGRAGLDRLFSGSVSSELVRQAAFPPCCWAPQARGFSSMPQPARWTLTKVLVPIDHDPPRKPRSMRWPFNAAHGAALDRSGCRAPAVR
ncbi:MAG: universal stress protein [Novosphingobium sp.]|nr:universal stress protein [Novosphingobium sp.]